MIREGRLKKLGLGLNWRMTGEGGLENLRLGLKWEMTGKGGLGNWLDKAWRWLYFPFALYGPVGQVEEKSTCPAPFSDFPDFFCSAHTDKDIKTPQKKNTHK